MHPQVRQDHKAGDEDDDAQHGAGRQHKGFLQCHQPSSEMSSHSHWHWEEGEDTQRNDTEFCKGKVHSNDIYQNLLRDVGGPEHDKTERQRQRHADKGELLDVG